MTPRPRDLCYILQHLMGAGDRMLRNLIIGVTVGLTVTNLANAAGTATPKPPAPPAADFSILPEEASFRPTNSDGTPHQVEMHIIADRAAVSPGETIRLGVWLEQDEHWHTYWRYNNDVGLPTDIEWMLPNGAENTDYEYPIPQRFDLSEIVSYGYDDQAFFFTNVTIPADTEPGTFEFAAKATWLTCEVQCINGEGEVKLPITVGPPPAEDPFATNFTPIFEHFGQQHPMPAKEANALIDVQTTIEPEGGLVADKPWKVVFELNAKDGSPLGAHQPLGADSWPTLVPQSNKDMLWLEPVTVETTESGGFKVTLFGDAFETENPQPIPVGGLFQVQVGDTWVRTELAADLTWSAPASAETPAASDTPDGDSGSDAIMTAAVVDDPTCATMKAGLGNTPEEVEDGGILNMLMMLAFAFIGGLILNIMPCVLPVLTLKIYSLIEQKGDSTQDRITEGVAYTAGIVVSFLALAGVLIGLQSATGMQAGWGFMMQNPAYVGVLGMVVFAFGLSMLGVFEIPVIGGGAAAGAGSKEGVAGYFLTGVFAVLLATPCSAPFLGPAMGFAFSQPPALLLLFMVMVGLGLASPFLLVAFIPGFYKVIPSPGPWMETFKQVMGFTLIGTAIWLVFVLAGQISQDALLGYVAFSAFIAAATWIFGHFGGLAASGGRQAVAGLAALIVIGVGGYIFVDLPMFLGWSTEGLQVKKDHDADHGIPWKMLTEERSAELLNRYRGEGADGEFAGKTVFIDFTADWCLSCKVNEKTFIDTAAVEEKIAELDAVAIQADWTRRDEMIGSWLSCYQTAGVPYYLVLPADPSQPAIQIGEALTSSQDVVTALEQGAGQASNGPS